VEDLVPGSGHDQRILGEGDVGPAGVGLVMVDHDPVPVCVSLVDPDIGVARERREIDIVVGDGEAGEVQRGVFHGSGT
jgi:hypothetical protein